MCTDSWSLGKIEPKEALSFPCLSALPYREISFQTYSFFLPTQSDASCVTVELIRAQTEFCKERNGNKL